MIKLPLLGIKPERKREDLERFQNKGITVYFYFHCSENKNTLLCPYFGSVLDPPFFSQVLSLKGVILSLLSDKLD